MFDFIAENFNEFLTYTGFANATAGNLIMIVVGAIFIYLAIKKDFEPLLLVPIGLGIILGNIPFRGDAGLEIGLYEDNSVLNIFYQGVRQGWYPPLIFLGIGAMTDFSALLANPKLLLVGAAAQFGIFGAYMIALALGFEPNQAAGIAIIGGADGPTAIFLSSKLSPNLMGAIAVCAYSYMALVPLIQPPIMRLLTTQKERTIKMKPGRNVSQTERILFPIIGLLITTFIVPSALPLLGMLFFGNLLKESGKTTRLAKTAGNALNDIVVVLLGLTVGCSTQASEFLTLNTVFIFAIGAFAFAIATASGVRPPQLPAYARHGPERGWCHRLGCGSRCPPRFPVVSRRRIYFPSLYVRVVVTICVVATLTFCGCAASEKTCRKSWLLVEKVVTLQR